MVALLQSSIREAETTGVRLASATEIASFTCSKRDQELILPRSMRNLLWCLRRLWPCGFAVKFRPYLKTNTKPSFFKGWYVCTYRVHTCMYFCSPVWTWYVRLISGVFIILHLIYRGLLRERGHVRILPRCYFTTGNQRRQKYMYISKACFDPGYYKSQFSICYNASTEGVKLFVCFLLEEGNGPKWLMTLLPIWGVSGLHIIF